MNLDEYIGKDFYFIPYEFKENCKQGKPTEIREMTITRKEEGDCTQGRWTDDYIFENPKYPSLRFSEHAVRFYLNAKIDAKCGIGLYLTLADAKKAANEYIEKEIIKAERAMQSTQKRKNNLTKCLIKDNGGDNQ